MVELGVFLNKSGKPPEPPTEYNQWKLKRRVPLKTAILIAAGVALFMAGGTRLLHTPGFVDLTLPAEEFEPLQPVTPTLAINPPNTGLASRVWVNPDGGVYYFPESRWFANTHNGYFTTEADARVRGYQLSNSLNLHY